MPLPCQAAAFRASAREMNFGDPPVVLPGYA